jgi:hypothetical protein
MIKRVVFISLLLATIVVSARSALSGAYTDPMGNKWYYTIVGVYADSNYIYVDVANNSSTDGWVKVNLWGPWAGWKEYTSQDITIKMGGIETVKFSIPPGFKERTMHVRVVLTGGWFNEMDFDHTTVDVTR